MIFSYKENAHFCTNGFEEIVSYLSLLIKLEYLRDTTELQFSFSSWKTINYLFSNSRVHFISY